MEIEFPETWVKYGEKWLDDVLRGIEEVHPLIGFEYEKLTAQYDANVEKELTTWMDEAYPNSDERSVDGMRTVECGFFWMHYRLYKDIDRKEIDDVSSPYISMSFSLYEKIKSILGFDD